MTDESSGDGSETLGRSVLVGVDGSDESREAALLGQRLAEGAAGSLRLVTAASHAWVEAAATRGGLSPEKLEEGLVRAATAKVLAPLRGDFPRAELDELVVRLGTPEKVLSQAAEELGADVMILGGRRARGPAPRLRRRIARRLLHLCDIPVVVAGPEGSRIGRILVAVDRSRAAQQPLRVARRLGELLGVPVSAIHVVDLPTFPPGLELDLDPDDLARREAASAQAELVSLAPEDVEVSVVVGDVVESLMAAVRSNPATALVLGAQGRGAVHRLVLGSVTEALLAELPCTVVAVPSWPGSEERRRND